MLNRNNALVVFSGGQDSTTCLFWAIKKFDHVVALSFSYGQNHIKELEQAKKIAEFAKVEWEVIDASYISRLGRNSLTDSKIKMDEVKPKGTPPNTFVPGRNLFFISMAAVVAREKNIANIVTGVSQTDFSGYPDCRDSFIKSLCVTLNLGMEEQFSILTPLMWKNKKETWALADELEIFDLVRDATLTCYNNIIGEGCGHCPACTLRAKGLKEYLKEKNNG